MNTPIARIDGVDERLHDLTQLVHLTMPQQCSEELVGAAPLLGGRVQGGERLGIG